MLLLAQRYRLLRWLALLLPLLALLLLMPLTVQAGGPPEGAIPFDFPRSLESYQDEHIKSISAKLLHRIKEQPFNALATLIFFCAIAHTFMASRFLTMAHHYEEAHKAKIAKGEAPRKSVSHLSELFHFLGEVEVVFGLWAVALGASVIVFFDWSTFVSYLSLRVDFTEALFVVSIMTLASTRPILWLAEEIMGRVARFFGGSLAAWWVVILTMGPILGSIITEPAAMTISALLLARKFYALGPSELFKYATLGLLFVNISVGGTFTHFAAPPVLMVAGAWNWDTPFMLFNFGWKAAVGILVANAIYFMVFRRELSQLQDSFGLRKMKDQIHKQHVPRALMESRLDELGETLEKETQFTTRLRLLIEEDVQRAKDRLRPEYFEHTDAQGIDRELAESAFEERFEEVSLGRMREYCPILLPEEQRGEIIDPDWDERDDPVPGWIIWVHVLFLAWTVFTAHYPPLFIGGLLFFLGFAMVTSQYQNRIDLKPPLLVGFFLAGLVVHGGFQGWWIEPVLGSLTEVPLMLTATVLTAFNDNAAITYLTTLIPSLSDELKYAVVSGAVAGGGLTVIANAPNPAGQSLLKDFFYDGVSPLKLFAGALAPTVIMLLAYYFLG